MIKDRIMERKTFFHLRFLPIFFLLICLNGCGKESKEGGILVYIQESGDFTVEDNGVHIRPGESAVFHLELPTGAHVTSVDYAGAYRLSSDGKRATLELKDVCYPVKVRVETSSIYHTIYYHPNGADGEAVAVDYNTSLHPRPNTSIGTDLFSRDGYTLTGWNTAPDGSGTGIGLGSRVTVTEARTWEDETLTGREYEALPGRENTSAERGSTSLADSGIGMHLFACWAMWTPDEAFVWERQEEQMILQSYVGEEGGNARVVIPEYVDGLPVRVIAAGAFEGCDVKEVILPKSLESVEEGAFLGCLLESLTLFDNIEQISDASFSSCDALRTLHINAIEDPYGYRYRKESVYADKVDLLLCSQGKQRLIFYGGCSMWYNLDGKTVQERYGDQYAIINLGLNGTVNSLVQMEILGAFLQEGDVVFHTPELSSRLQLLLETDMGDNDDKLWSGLEYNYDLFSLVDIRKIQGVFSSLQHYLQKKKPGGNYRQFYVDSNGRRYLDEVGSIPFERNVTSQELADEVRLDPKYLEDGLKRLSQMYQEYEQKGARVLVSYACVNMDAVPVEEQGNAAAMDERFRETMKAMDGPVLISRLQDYLYYYSDFYDTNFHLLSAAAKQNTEKWMRDLEGAFDQEEASVVRH